MKTPKFLFVLLILLFVFPSESFSQFLIHADLATGLRTPQGQITSWEQDLKKFMADGEVALRGLTGTRTVHMTAKSWIDPSSISLLISWRNIVLRLSPNNEPSGSNLNSGISDFKLYQTFVAEATFENGKVVSARFLENSLDVRAGKTFRISEGLTYVKESRISDWKGKERVVFTRTVGGRPALLFTEPLEKIMKEPFQDIFNTISVEIKGDAVIPHGYGSDFPSHKFWIGDKLFAQKKQVQPLDYFK